MAPRIIRPHPAIPWTDPNTGDPMYVSGFYFAVDDEQTCKQCGRRPCGLGTSEEQALECLAKVGPCTHGKKNMDQVVETAHKILVKGE